MGKWLIVTGIILIIAGLLLHYAPGIFKWFGNLPGDIRIEKGGSRFFFPITSMIVISVILTILVNILKHFNK